MLPETLAIWEPHFAAYLRDEAPPADAAHGLDHIQRVVALAKQLAQAEGADLAVVLPAAWLHDCVSIPKQSPDRSRAALLAAQQATTVLTRQGYPARYLPAIAHAIEAHSFSSGVAPRTLEAQVVQDADNLDALGAIGIARCLLVGGSLGSALYHPDEPLPLHRPPDDRQYILDHFFTKLLPLAERLHTPAARQEGQRRRAAMLAFLAQFHADVSDELAPKLPDHIADSPRTM
jgi:uncharacterized protein